MPWLRLSRIPANILRHGNRRTTQSTPRSPILTRFLRHLTTAIRGVLPPSPLRDFHAAEYLRHNQRRLEHLSTLGLSISHRRVLELGAGIGDHTSFFVDRGCEVVTSDGRAANVRILQRRYPRLAVYLLDMDSPSHEFSSPFEVVYCYGLLYHLRNPRTAIAYMARNCSGILLLETCVSFGRDVAINPVVERASVPSQAISGWGCRPTRYWLYAELRSQFAHVYLPTTQPWHEEFPTDWSSPPRPNALTRAIFVASRMPLANPLLREEIPIFQTQQ